MILGFDTATPATAVGLLRADGSDLEARHEPPAGERLGHATRLLPLAFELLDEAGASMTDVRRIAVGLGPGTFTGLRIGIATARALAQGSGAELVGVSTLRTLAAAAASQRVAPDERTPTAPGEPTPCARLDATPSNVLAVIDARRGEVYTAAYTDGREILAPAPRRPEALARALAGLPRPARAVGDGAVACRSMLEASGLEVPRDSSPLHRVSASRLCRLARAAPCAGRETVRPDYLRLPDADLRPR